MNDVDAKVCSLEQKKVLKGGILGFFTTEYVQTVALGADGQGMETLLAKSELAKRSRLGKDRLHEVSRQCNRQVVGMLSAKGWEPAGTDRFGLVSVMKRQLHRELGRSSAPTRPSGHLGPTELLTQLASLRDAGVLTEEEFIGKKAEILKRA